MGSLVLLGLCLGAVPAWAHDFQLTATTAELGDERFEIDMTVDLDALLLGVGPGHDEFELASRVAAMEPTERERAIERLRTLFLRRVRVYFDGDPVDFEVDFPDLGSGDVTGVAESLGITVRLRGAIPEDARTFSFRSSRSLPDIELSIVRGGRAFGNPELLPSGEPSREIDLTAPMPARSPWSSAALYLRLGFLHIVPRGLDHILFVLALFLLSARVGTLLAQVTVFTVAHAATLALSTFDIVSLSPRIVEPLIALSIAAVAIENLFHDRLRAWRVAVVALFGLLHGLGFAGVLREIGLPPGERLIGLVAFNVGVELGQIAVVLIAVAVVWKVREKEWYRPWIVRPASLLLALIGLVWTVERLLG